MFSPFLSLFTFSFPSCAPLLETCTPSGQKTVFLALCLQPAKADAFSTPEKENEAVSEGRGGANVWLGLLVLSLTQERHQWPLCDIITGVTFRTVPLFSHRKKIIASFSSSRGKTLSPLKRRCAEAKQSNTFSFQVVLNSHGKHPSRLRLSSSARRGQIWKL